MEQGIASELLMKTLSDDAKSVLGGYFGYLGIPGRSTLCFGMKETKPTERGQKAFDELVAAGAFVRKPMELGRVEYTVQINCSDFGRWLSRNKKKAKWAVTEPINPTTAR